MDNNKNKEQTDIFVAAGAPPTRRMVQEFHVTMAKRAFIVLFAILLLAGSFKVITYLVGTVDATEGEIIRLTEEKVVIEIDLKNAIQKENDAKREADNAKSQADSLRQKRETLETSINTKINPAPITEEVK